MRIKPPLILLLLSIVALTACEGRNPASVTNQGAIIPEFSRGDKPGQPVLGTDWLYKDSFDNSPINLSGVLASQGSQGMSETGLLPVTILGKTWLDFDEIEVVTMGDGMENDTPWEMDGQGDPLIEETYRDKDDLLDLMVHFNLRAMYENGDISTETTRLCLTVTMQGDETLEMCKPVTVI